MPMVLAKVARHMTMRPTRPNAARQPVLNEMQDIGCAFYTERNVAMERPDVWTCLPMGRRAGEAANDVRFA